MPEQLTLTEVKEHLLMKMILALIILFIIQPHTTMATKKPGKPVSKTASTSKSPKKVLNHLNEVKITATRLAKPSTTTRLYPKGEVKNTQIDSIRRANPSLGRAIGQPSRKPGQQAQFGTNQSDLIKQAIKPRKKK